MLIQRASYGHKPEQPLKTRFNKPVMKLREIYFHFNAFGELRPPRVVKSYLAECFRASIIQSN